MKTELEDVVTGVRFVLRGSTPAIAMEARRRARSLADFTAGRSKEKHGGGKGGGFMRNCPILTKDATVLAEDIDGGVQITVTPNDPAKLAEFRATARERFDRAPLERASIVREEKSDQGETRLYSGSVADLDGDGTLELVAGGFVADANGQRPTLVVYRQRGDSWAPLTEASWDSEPGSTVRNVEIADTDGDGKLDVIALGRIGASTHVASAHVTISSLEGGKLVQHARQDWRTGQYSHGYGLAIGDLDGDGKPEIVTSGFESDGKTVENGFVRIWKHERKGVIAPHGSVVLDGQGSPSMRVNDIAIGDVDGDGAPEIVAAGRHGPLKTEDSKDLSKRRETGDLAVLSFKHGQLTILARHSWLRGTSTRFRTVAIADLDGDRKPEIVVGGQYDGDGKAALVSLGFESSKLVVKQDASSATEGVTGEVKDLIVARDAKELRLIATGVMGDKPGRQGTVGAWRVKHGQIVRDASIVSRNGDETRTRAVLIVPSKHGNKVITIGHARTGTAVVGQLLQWTGGDLL
ncbi:MAG: VCBS repeat-containing protein [Kofleriaceae bacterium]